MTRFIERSIPSKRRYEHEENHAHTLRSGRRGSPIRTDRRIASEREQRGASEAARHEFLDLQGMDYESHWWELAYTPSGEFVGMVMPTGSPTFGTIGYIGVVPEQRGHGYGDVLLARGTATLCRAGYERLVCDTDVANVPMANAFRRANYTQFGTRREYRLENITTS